MKRKYSVRTRFVFNGTFIVNASNKTQAAEYVNKHCGLVLGGDIHSTLSPGDVDWNFPHHPEKEIGHIICVGQAEVL